MRPPKAVIGAVKHGSIAWNGKDVDVTLVITVHNAGSIGAGLTFIEQQLVHECTEVEDDPLPEPLVPPGRRS